MIGIVVVTHGQLAEHLVEAARTIVGEIPRIAAVSIGWSDDMGTASSSSRPRTSSASRSRSATS